LLTVTNPKPSLWIIELHNGQDNRLTHTLINHGLKPALDAVEKSWREEWRAAKAAKDQNGGKGALIIVGKRDQDKFFSNGFDFANIIADPTFFPETFNPLLVRVMEFPIPTIAAINGHCFAAGLSLAMACDYRVMTDGSKRNAWLCMNEVHFGAVWPLSFAALFRAKLGEHRLLRKVALEGHRFTPSEALSDGILDGMVKGGTKEVLEKAIEIADAKGNLAKEGVWGLIKRDLYRDAIEWAGKDIRMTNAFIEDTSAKARL